jgi:hypothetical protein
VSLLKYINAGQGGTASTIVRRSHPSSTPVAVNNEAGKPKWRAPASLLFCGEKLIGPMFMVYLRLAYLSDH